MVRSEGRYNPNFYKEMKKIMGLFFGTTGGLSGFLQGYIVGRKTPRNFEESQLKTRDGKDKLRYAIRDALNESLVELTRFGGIEHIHFTNFIIQ